MHTLAKPLAMYMYLSIVLDVLCGQVMGKIGTVVAISDSGDLKIRYPENLIYSLCAEAVVKARGGRGLGADNNYERTCTHTCMYMYMYMCMYMYCP